MGGSLAQPINDDCNQASLINISGAGFDLGTFMGSQVDLSSATSQVGENYAPSIIVSGLNKKSVWYKFSIPTHRSIRVNISQPGSAIQAGNVGFAVYKSGNCLPGDMDLSNKLSRIETFGNTFHPCVDPGEYLVQVSGSNAANGPIVISLEIGEALPATYDKLINASSFNLLNSKNNSVDYWVECQSIDVAEEICQTSTDFQSYTKSTWHTFTTPQYFNFINVMAGYIGGSDGTNTSKYGYRIFEGDPALGLSGLQQVGACDSLVSNFNNIGFKGYTCDQLKPNTAYTIQLLYHKNFKGNFRFAVDWNGAGPTKAPLPVTSISAPNNLGLLKSNTSYWGELNVATDTFACNARHIVNNCFPVVPADGVIYQGNTYNLSSFFTFKLATTSTLFFGIGNGCNSNLLLRLFRKKINSDCNGLDSSNLVNTFPGNYTIYSNNPIQCLDSGDYVLQVMGRDTINDYRYIYWNGCTFNDLGRQIDLTISVRSEIDINKFSLSATGKFDKINADASGNMQPLTPARYTATPDTFGCGNTVLPDSVICNNLTKASYREFVVSDSVIMMDHYSSNYYWKIYKSDANNLATSQGTFNYPQQINGMKPYTLCSPGEYSAYETGVCLVPGTYTIVSLDNRISRNSIMDFTIVRPKAKYNAPEKAEDLGDILAKISNINGGWLKSDIDTFSCTDNPLTIDGIEPCKRNNQIATKQIYRQFYLSKPSSINIYTGDTYLLPISSGVYTLFKGKVTDGIDQLKAYGSRWTCTSRLYSENQCDILPAGWYTIVEYGWGGTYNVPYANPYDQNNFGGSSVGKSSVVHINVNNSCASQQFNRPALASIDTATKRPYLIEWGNGSQHTAAYPETHKRYTLNTEYFNCANDTSYIKSNLSLCSDNISDHGKVAFYVFTTTQESYVNILNIPDNLWAMVYDFDVRGSDSIKLKTAIPFQACNKRAESIEFCKLQPGTYTLVFYAPLNYTCNSVTPWIYIDKVGYSRFDHAINAYDFGSIKPDSTWKNGKEGDVNPFDAARAPSNDFFYCTTGSQESDPNSAACMTEYNPEIYKDGNNIVLHPDNRDPKLYMIDRRNLWYTFKADHPGRIRVKVENKTPGKNGSHQQIPFAVYRSDVDANLSFDEVLVKGEMDSTLIQGLTLVKNNLLIYYYCNSSQEIEFFVEPCSFRPARYYIIAENRNMYGYDYVKGMNPNHQIEVSVLLDSVNSNPPKFDHYSFANDLGLVNTGKKRGEIDNFSCATRDLPDPIYSYSDCKKTLWYKFTTTTSGTIRYAAFFKGRYEYYYDHIQLFRQVKPNDSTNNGLQFLPYTSTFQDNGFWAQQCIAPGTYYIILPGCNAISEDVFPEIEILSQTGDFCTNPVVTEISGVSSKIASTIIDCHTIGTDYGEFNKNLSCPPNGETSRFKSSWYRLDITGRDTLDVTVFLGNKTNVDNANVNYRMMTGSCGAMQEQSCVQDALTRNTFKCLAPGNSYYIQVFTPTSTIYGVASTGIVDLNVSSIIHVDTCLPADPCISVANFTPEFNCKTDKVVRFTNYSTYGNDIKYSWDFGYNGLKSNLVSPTFFYPAQTTDTTYKIKLVVQNTACGKMDSIEQSIFIPARPYVDLGPDTIFCKSGSAISFDATSFTGATYYWNNGSNQPIYSASNSGKHIVELSYNGCISRDTVDVWINPISKSQNQFFALCNNNQVNLNAAKGYGERFRWNTNQTTANISIAQPGVYWVDIYLNTCIVRDSFNVVSTNLNPLGNDTLICQQNLPYKMDAKIAGATSYLWNDNTTSSTFMANNDGLYWVDIVLGGCVLRDSVFLKTDTVQRQKISAQICFGQNYISPSGKTLTTSGVYLDTLINRVGCDSLITDLKLEVIIPPKQIIDTFICFGNTYKLPSGKIVSREGVYLDSVFTGFGCLELVTQVSIRVVYAINENISEVICDNKLYRSPSGKLFNNAGNYLDTIRNINGCDSIRYTLTLQLAPTYKIDTTIAICEGGGYKLPGGKIVYVAGLFTDSLKTKIWDCDSIINTTITVLPKLSVTLNKPNALCFGDNVLLTAKASGGIGKGYIYKWSNSDFAGSSLQVAPASTEKFSVSVTDGCTVVSASDSVTVKVNPLPDTTILISPTQVCLGEKINFSSKATIERYKWNWGTGIPSDTSDARSVSFVYQDTGTYTVTVDLLPATGCNVRKIQSVKILGIPDVQISAQKTACVADSVTFTGVNNTSDITSWKWKFENGSEDTGQRPQKQTYLKAGIYKITMIAENVKGCRDTALFDLTINPLPFIGLGGRQTPLCLGSSIKLYEGKGLTYSWSPSTYIDVTDTGVIASPKQDMLYNITITNEFGCKAKDSLYLKVMQPFSMTASVDTFICTGGSVELFAAGADTYTWTGQDFTEYGSKIIVKPKATTRYKVKGSGEYGCFTVTKEIEVKVIPYPTIELGNDTTLMVGTRIQLKPSYSADVSKFSWSPSTYLSCITCPEPFTEPEQPIEYTVTVSNSYNCATSDSKKINLICGTESVFLPNTFTPNNDGMNDVLYPRGEGIKRVRYLRIFNRWGQLLFEKTNFNTNDISMAWDGTFRGKPLPPDVFVFSMALVCDNNQLVETRGNVMIVR
jgi:gliding motility-associated-like protein